ncbi:alpha/beta hydrolase [Cumulibacter manganitolerans]|uniref:alpha/beta hydrolase n=1 Tax=Cumulibacter manganitolerans TaxID=1884992 RepID=UPI0012965859|nr:alpha/beta fold hydrolase [Cumulibacter manganitolerans]
MTLLAGAEPFEQIGDSPSTRQVGVLLSHGFSGAPASMVPWAQALAAAGHSVSVPRLPGHGTRWQDMNRTRWQDWYGELERALERLAGHCERIVLAGLSMGGTLAIRLTEEYGPAGAKSLGDRLVGTVLVNPSLATQRKDARLLPLAQRFIGSFPGIAGDIAKPGVREVAYDRLPLKAAYSLQELWAVARADLSSFVTPLLLFQSVTDHVVEAVSSKILLEGVASSDVSHRLLHRSFHVATLDYDAPYIFEESIRWIGAHSEG